MLQQQAAAREQQLKAQLQSVMANGTEAQRRELQAGQDALSQQVGSYSRIVVAQRLASTKRQYGKHGIRDPSTFCTKSPSA